MLALESPVMFNSFFVEFVQAVVKSARTGGTSAKSDDASLCAKDWTDQAALPKAVCGNRERATNVAATNCLYVRIISFFVTPPSVHR